MVLAVSLLILGEVMLMKKLHDIGAICSILAFFVSVIMLFWL